MRSAWGLVAGLVGLEVVLSWLSWDRARQEHVVYVLTPMVDVVPGGAPLSAEEALRLGPALRTQVDARDMQSAFAWLGSTLSLDDLMRGVESLEASPHPMDADQRAAARALLDGARAEHAELRQLQRDILADEAAISADVAAVLALLPEDQRARVRGGR